MGEWTDSDLDIVRGVVADQLNKQQLTKGQKWEMTLVLAGITIGAVTLLTFAGRPLVEQVSRDHAENVALETFTERVLNDQDFVKSVRGDTAAIPSGAVLAFDRNEGCPPGWFDFTDGFGRVLIGAGDGKDLSRRDYRERKGEEVVSLNLSQIPKHQHDTVVHAVPARFGSGQNTFNSIIGKELIKDRELPLSKTSEIGGGIPHNNMPPYIALYFCKKD